MVQLYEANKTFKEFTGMSYQEMGQFMMEQRRIFIDEIYDLEKKGKISKNDFDSIIKKGSEHFFKHSPGSLPPIS